MSAPSSCFVTHDAPVQLLRVMCSAKECYGFPYGHLIYFHFQEASSPVDSDVLHIRFSVKGVRVTGSNLAELVASLTANTLQLIQHSPPGLPAPSLPSDKKGEPFISSIEIVEIPDTKPKKPKN